MPNPILIIDDEIAIRRFLRASLTDEGYRVSEAETAREGLRLLLQESPAAVLLDLGLPDREGRELITEVRGWSSVPIIVLSARRVFRDDHEIRLTKLEYDLLAAMVKNSGKVLTHQYLLKEVWGPLNVQETHYLRVFVATLRKKIESDAARPKLIVTEQGVGYRFADPDE